MQRSLLALFLLAGCTPSALTQAALQADLPALRSELARARVEHRLDEGTVKELAGAVARRELLSSQGEAAVARIRELGPCLGYVRDDVQSRAMDGSSTAAATATLALLEAGFVDDEEQLVANYLASEDPMWRAVAARALTQGAKLSSRQQLFIDGDLRVRRAALHAALESPLKSELEALLETARLDPDPMARSLAVRILGKFDDVRAVQGLRELWSNADAGLRQGIVEAWADTLQVSGMGQLRWALETQSGLPQIVAAARAYRAGFEAPQALATLGRAIETGPSDEQRLALRLAPALPQLQLRVEKATQHNDVRVQVAAQRALLAYPDKREAALSALLRHSKSSPAPAAQDARDALVATGDVAVVADLLPELASKTADVRAVTGLQLVALQHYADAAPQLADDVASVRTRVACAILAR